jgi:hypothetical protein
MPARRHVAFQAVLYDSIASLQADWDLHEAMLRQAHRAS